MTNRIQTLLIILFLTGGVVLRSFDNNVLSVLGAALFIAGVIPSVTEAISTPFANALFKKSYSELGTGITKKHLQMDLYGGDHLAFFVFSEGEAYLNFLLDFVITGINSKDTDELVVFIVKDKTTKDKIIKDNPNFVDNARLSIKTVDALPAPTPELDFFESIRPIADEIESEMKSLRGGAKYKSIRLIADDVTQLYYRQDFQRAKKNFNSQMEQFLYTYEFFRDLPFYSLGTYREGSFITPDGKPSSNIPEELSIVLMDHDIFKTLVLTEDNLLLGGEGALKYLFENDKLWGQSMEFLIPLLPQSSYFESPEWG